MSEYQDIPLSRLHESTYNHRSNFDEAALTGLSASIATHGVLQPLLVRPSESTKDHGAGYEIIAGARRFRAATMAQLTVVPVRIVNLSDAEALEASVIENLQRVDVHPLEEALGFRALLEFDQAVRYDVGMIADKTGKSKQYVVTRIKLADLIPEAQKEFMADRMQIGHALILCRLTEANQRKALPEIWEEDWEEEEMNDGEHESKDVRILTPVSVKQFAHWCSRSFLLVLADAPFDIKSKKFTEGPCTNCSKRSGYNKLLFAEIATDSCTDPICYASKQAQTVAMTLKANPDIIKVTDSYRLDEEELKEFGKDIMVRQQYTAIDPDQKFDNDWARDRAKEDGELSPCKSMVPAVYIDGDEKGKVVNICHVFTCKTHPRTKASAQVPRGSGYKEPTPEERKATRAKELLEIKIKSTSRIQIFEAVVAEVPKKIGERELRFIAQILIDRMPFQETNSIAQRWGLYDPKSKQSRSTTEKKLKEHIRDILVSELPALIIETIVFQSANSEWHGGLDFAAESFGVDTKNIAKTVRADLTAAAKEKADKAKATAKAKEAKDKAKAEKTAAAA